MTKTDFYQLLEQKILVMDGAMGTMIQRHGLTEEDYRGSRFQDYPSDLKGNNDLLSITQPDIIREIHKKYLMAGADIIETNTFNAQAISLADYDMQDLALELNKASAQLAREAIDSMGTEEPKIVAGSIGPTNRTLSISPDVNNPAYRAVTFDEVAEAYLTQIQGLMEGGADVLLIETIFDTLNAKAAIYAAKEYSEKIGKEIPIMISGTITDASGRTLSGQTLGAFYTSVAHADPVSIGLNCALGAAEMTPHIEELNQISEFAISAYPNAGLPNAMGEYDQKPQQTAEFIRQWGEAGYLNIVGGCCGTTPEHISAMADTVRNLKPRSLRYERA